MRITHSSTPVLAMPERQLGMAFDVGAGGRSVTVTLSDRSSGEVVRKLVFHHGGPVSASTDPTRGQLIDIAL